MQAAVAIEPEMPAVEVRERLVEFVAEMAAVLPRVRQRENALVYVRGLIEQGGRKSLQPTLFRLGEDAARYESLQQFLADSPWDPGLLVRACAERVAPEQSVIGVLEGGVHIGVLVERDGQDEVVVAGPHEDQPGLGRGRARAAGGSHGPTREWGKQAHSGLRR